MQCTDGSCLRSQSLVVACLRAAWRGHTGGSEEVVQQLLDLGCDAGQADADGCTPWHAAVQSGSAPLVVRLLDAGCGLEAANSTGCTALHFAARTGAAQLCPLLKSWLPVYLYPLQTLLARCHASWHG